ncbi:MAG: hypothetical protein SFX73_33485 [Kofleriaceae bacterium]|nr:hypothetical protein [Kofleriaceae bacterium]
MRPLLLLCLVTACASDFAPVSRVEGYRILASRADQPIARPGETVTLEALAVDAQGRPFQLAWSACTRPAAPTPLACLEALDGGFVPGPTTFTATVPADALVGIPPEAAAAVTIGVVHVICPGAVETMPGALPVCRDLDGQVLASDEYDVAVKRLGISELARNQNPVIDAVLLDGRPWPAEEIPEIAACDDATTNQFDDCDVAPVEVAIATAASSFEPDEQLISQYYANEGVFENEVKDARSPTTRFKARAGARGTTVTLWFVVRDDRGGAAWTSRQLNVR